MWHVVALLSEFNVALRGEVLQFATSGIRASAIRSSKVAENYKKTVISMIHRDDSNASSNNFLTGWVFLRLIFGSKSDLLNVTTMISESDPRLKGRGGIMYSDEVGSDGSINDQNSQRTFGSSCVSPKQMSSDDDGSVGICSPMNQQQAAAAAGSSDGRPSVGSPITERNNSNRKKGSQQARKKSSISYYDPEMDTYIGRISDVTEFGGKDVHTIEEGSGNPAGGGFNSVDSTSIHESKSIFSSIYKYCKNCYLTFTDQEAGHFKTNTGMCMFCLRYSFIVTMVVLYGGMWACIFVVCLMHV